MMKLSGTVEQALIQIRRLEIVQHIDSAILHNVYKRTGRHMDEQGVMYLSEKLEKRNVNWNLVNDFSIFALVT